MKMWAGRFSKGTDSKVEEFTASLTFDRVLYFEDIIGSVAHVKMLHKIKILNETEKNTILNGLKELLEEFENKTVTFEQSDEDIHMAVERLLKNKIGALAGKIHTGRSRNDQVALDMHLFLRTNTVYIIELITNLIKELYIYSKDNLDIIIPGYTHLQRAQPVLFAHHLLAYCSMFFRDIERFKESLQRLDWLPLGSGALAGTTFPIDRFYVAKILKFSNVYTNSMDAVGNRDFVLEFLSNSAILMSHLSRISEEIILWSSSEFGFIELDDGYCTGSSIMPQKKNPDVAELVRGKTGRVYGSLLSMLTIMKSLPMTYNKDLQEDKEGFLDTLSTITRSLDVYAPMIKSMKLKKDKIKKAIKEDFSNATDIADYLVVKGIPFRDAHEITGKIVKHCIDQNVFLDDLSLDTYLKFSNLFDEKIFEAIKINNVVNRRDSFGGTGQNQVKIQIENISNLLTDMELWIKSTQAKYELNPDEIFS